MSQKLKNQKTTAIKKIKWKEEVKNEQTSHYKQALLKLMTQFKENNENNDNKPLNLSF